MSTTIDQRVVEMRFDNQQFERNVSTTMSTLEKLKAKLNFSGASKGLEDINTSIKRVDMSNLGNSVDAVGLRFNALYTIADQTLRNITNRVEHTAMKMASALTIDPIKTGFQEYETQINATQTILANTASKGSDINDVNKALKELNDYADLTIYNFTEMTRNIGTFTAAGIDLDTATNAIQGIANLAAVSGSTSQQASTAMYQLSQALAAGSVKLMDWNSVVNAGMGGEMFQNALRETSELLGTGAEEAIKASGSFRESLKDGWITSEVLTETLKKFTTTGANEYVAEYTGLSKEAVEAALEEAKARYGEADAIEQASKALAEKSGKNKEEIKSVLAFAKNAEDAATKVKTFTQLWDVLKEAAQSGWSQTWKLIVGNFEQAKSLLTPLSDFMTGIINGISNTRNAIIESAFGKTFANVADNVKKALKPIEATADSIKTVAKSVEQYGEVIDDIIGGKFGDGQERINKLTEAGYDWAHAQNLVNEKLGDSTRHATNYSKAQEKVAESHDKTTDASAGLTEAQKKQLKTLASMDESLMRSQGYTEDQIEAFRELADTAKKLGIPMDEFIDNLDKIDGRWLFINAFKNAGQGLVSVFKAIGQAWREAFHGDASDEAILEKRSNALFDIIAAFHRVSTYLTMNEETMGKLTRTFKGLFAILDMVTTAFGGGFKIAIKIISDVLGYFDLNVLDATAAIGDSIVAFRDWFESIFDVTKVLDVLVPVIKDGIATIRRWIAAFLKMPKVEKAIETITNVFEEFKNMDFSEYGKNIVEGLQNGIVAGAKAIVKNIIQLASDIISNFCEVLGIHSPSTVMYDIGVNIIQGLVNGLQYAVSGLKNGIGSVCDYIVDLFKNIEIPEEWLKAFENALTRFKTFIKEFDYEKLLTIIPIGAVLLIVKKVYDIGKVLVNGIESVNELIDSFAGVGKSLQKVLNSFALNIKAKALKNLAIAIAILAGSIIALTFVDPDKLFGAVFTIMVLAGTLAALAFALDKMNTASLKIDKQGLNLEGVKSSIMSIGITLLMLAGVVKLVGSMKPEEAQQGFKALAALMAGILVFLAAMVYVTKFNGTEHIDKLGSMMIKLSIAMALMVGVCKLVGKLSPGEMENGAKFAGAFGLMVMTLALVSQFAGEHVSKIGGMMIKLSIAMGLMIGVCKLVGTLSQDEMKKGALFAGAFAIFIAILVGVTKIGSEQQIAKIGGLLASVSLSILLMVGVCKLVGKLTPKEAIAGAAFVAVFGGLVIALVGLTKISNEQQMAKVAGTILAMSIAIGVMAGVAVLLGMVRTDWLIKGVAAVSALGLVMAAMIWATRGASNCMKNLIVMTIAIALMTGAVAVLSNIDGTKLAGSTLAIGSLMGMFALILKMSGNVGKSVGTLIVLTLAVGMIGGMIYLLAGMPVGSVLASAAAISVLLLSLSASMKIISTIGTVSSKALLSMGILTLIVGALGGILYLLSGMPVESTLVTATALSTLLIALSSACVILAAVGSFGPAGFIGVGVLATLIAGVGGLMVAIGALSDKFPKMEEFLNKGIPMLETIGHGLGSFFGNIIGGFAEGMTDSLPGIGTNLSGFMTNAQAFIDGAKSVDETALTGMTNLAKMVALVSGASIMNAVASGLFGDSSMETFSESLGGFADAIVNFSQKVSGNIDEASVLAAANAGKLMAEMNSTIPGTGGVLQWFCGEKDMATFGSQLVAFGNALVDFSKTVSAEGAINETAVIAAANAGKVMTEMQSNLVGTGGVIQWFCGEKDMSLFGTQLVAFGKAIVEFSKTVSGEGAINGEAITAAANAGKLMTEMQKTIIPTGGVMQWFTGEQNLETFGAQIKAFGEAMVGFSEIVAGNIDETAITAASNAGMIMANLQAAIPEDKWLDGKISLDDFGKKIKDFGGYIADYANEVADIDTDAINRSAFGANKLVSIANELGGVDPECFENFKIGSLGKALKGYYDKVADIDPSAISTSITNAHQIRALITSLMSLDASGVSTFTQALNSLGKANVAGFVQAFESVSVDLTYVGVNMIDSIVKGIVTRQGLLTATAGSLFDGFVAGINTKHTTIMGITSKMVIDMVNAVRSKKDIFKASGVTLTHSLVSGISSTKTSVKNALSTTLTSMVSSIRDYHSRFKSAGKYLVQGFADGIDENTFKAKATAKAMAKAALEAAEDALGIASPSKEFYSVGDYAGQGFVNALSDYGRISYKAGSAMADSARKGLNNAINKINNTLDIGGINTQPTIRPVLDLSEVRTGASAIGSLFNNPSVGVSANVNAIGAFAGRNQNGVNDDVVSAIKDLKRVVGNLSNTTYQVGGVTYDDGTNVSTAVRDLVRAVKIERRV